VDTVALGVGTTTVDISVASRDLSSSARYVLSITRTSSPRDALLRSMAVTITDALGAVVRPLHPI
jgi:hypothetical protein